MENFTGMEIDGAFLLSDRSSFLIDSLLTGCPTWMDDRHSHESMKVEESIMDQEMKNRLAVD